MSLMIFCSNIGAQGIAGPLGERIRTLHLSLSAVSLTRWLFGCSRGVAQEMQQIWHRGTRLRCLEHFPTFSLAILHAFRNSSLPESRWAIYSLILLLLRCFVFLFSLLRRVLSKSLLTSGKAREEIKVSRGEISSISTLRINPADDVPQCSRPSWSSRVRLDVCQRRSIIGLTPLCSVVGPSGNQG